MSENEFSNSTSIEVDPEVNTEPFELSKTSIHLDLPLHESLNPEIQDIKKMPNEKCGNGTEKNGQKRGQTTPVEAIIDVTSKKPRIDTPGDDNIISAKAFSDQTDLHKNADEDGIGLDKKAIGDETDFYKNEHKDETDEMEHSSDTEQYYLTVNNLPSEWTYVQIKNYLDQECGHVDEMEMLQQRNKNNAIRLIFQNLDKCYDVFKKLENKYLQKKKLRLKISDVYTTFPMDLPSDNQNSNINQFLISNEVIAASRWRPDLDCLDTDPEGVYGLRPEFLKTLGIQPPINRMVHVSNFRCDKAELKEVMEMAGNVLMCGVVGVITKYAKVVYSHPLEAVQAISMLNGQLFYGTPLKITMDKNHADSVVLPKGLANIGQGLGIKATPIRNIVEQYHRYANKQTSTLNPIIFSEIDFSDENVNKIKTDENREEIEKKIKEFMSSRPGCNIINPTGPLKENIDKLDSPDSKDESDCNTIQSKTKRGAKNNNVESPHGQTKNGGVTQHNIPPLLGTPICPPNPLVRHGNPSSNFMHPNMVAMPPVPMQNPLAMPGPREPFFRPGNPQKHLPFRPRVPFMPPSMQRPPFSRPRPPFGPAGMRPQVPHAGMRPQVPQAGMRPQVPPAGMRPQASPAICSGLGNNAENCVTVKFSNMPPTTTFPFLCDLLAKCGQVMSVQLTAPGCARATFSHPSHAERCFHNFNGLNVDGYVIEVIYA